MSRWDSDAAERLERAALELFAEQGYSETTVPQITSRAGLTTRTFFRHYVDKREVLFRREAELPGLVAGLTAGSPEGLDPFSLVMHGLAAASATRFDQWRGELLLRRSIVQAEARLRERELLKQSVLAESIRAGLVAQGVEESTAGLLAPVAVTIFDTALNRWLDDPDDAVRPLAQHVAETGRELQSALRSSGPGAS